MASTTCPQCGAVIHHDDANKDALANHIEEQHKAAPPADTTELDAANARIKELEAQLAEKKRDA